MASPVLPVATAGPKCWRDAAAGLGMSTEELPQDPQAVVQLLHHTLPSYVQLLLGDPAKPWSDPQHLSGPLQHAAVAGSSVAVAFIITAAPPVFWQPPLMFHGICAAVSRGDLGIFQQLAAAITAPNTYKGVMLGFAVGYHRCGTPACREIVSWLLQQYNWQPEELEHAIDFCASRAGSRHLLQQLLRDSGILWTPAQLAHYLPEAAGLNDLNLLKTLMSATAEQWQAEDVTTAIQSLITRDHDFDMDVLQLLMDWPGISWTAAAVAGLLVECIEELPEPWPAHLSSVLQQLVTMQGCSWTAESLAELLRVASATQDDGLDVVELLLKLPGMQWTATQLIPALAAAAEAETRGRVYCSCWSQMVNQLIDTPGVLWTAEDVGPIVAQAAAAAVETAGLDSDTEISCSVVEQLLAVPGVDWSTPDLVPAVKPAAAADDPCLLMMLLGNPSPFSYPSAEEKKMLEQLRALQWPPGELSPVLVDAVAEGRVVVVKQLLKTGGSRWQGEHLAPALAKAIALLDEEEQCGGRNEPGEGWEEEDADDDWYQRPLENSDGDPFLTWKEVDMLLLRGVVCWSAVSLAAVIIAAIKAGRSCACLARLLSVAQDSWSARALLPVLQHTAAAAGAQSQQVRMLLQMPGVKWEAGELAAVLQQLMVQCRGQLLVEDCSTAQLLKAPVSSYSQIKEI